tara:strand:- start:2692 stop:2868 length:177 start_codon:yes stop_codon:yes gene_type:complete
MKKEKAQNTNDSGINIIGMINIYKKLIQSGKMKLGSSGHLRMNQLKLRYKKGERNFQR